MKKQQSLLIFIIILFTGYTTVPPENEPSHEEEEITITNPTPIIENIFPVDLQTLIDQGIEQLLASKAIGSHQPTVAFNEVKNKTNDNLNIKQISDQIRNRLTNSGKINLINDDSTEINTEENFILRDKIRDNNRPPKYRFDKRKAKNYRLRIVVYDNPPQKYNNSDIKYYRIIFSLTDSNNEELIWVEEKDNIKRELYNNNKPFNKNKRIK